MEVLKRSMRTFLVGGCIGVVAQFFMMLYASFLPETLVVIISMLTIGIIGSILIITDVYPKIAKVGYFGADLPVCGLMFGAAMTTAMTRKAGAPAGKAFAKGFGAVATIVGIGFGACFIIGVMIALL